MKTFLTLVLALIALSATAAAQEEDSLSKKLANPLTAWVNVPIQMNYDDDLGPEEKGSLWSMNALPVLPFQIGDNWNLIARSVVPLIKQKDLTRERKTDSGLGDILQSFFFSPIKPTGGDGSGVLVRYCCCQPRRTAIWVRVNGQRGRHI